MTIVLYHLPLDACVCVCIFTVIVTFLRATFLFSQRFEMIIVIFLPFKTFIELTKHAHTQRMLTISN